MLIRAVSRVAVVVIFAIVALGVLAAPVSADYVECPPFSPCIVVVETPGSPGSGSDGGNSGGGGSRTCRWAGQEVPCSHRFDGQTGWFNESDGCYYYAMVTPPPAGSSLWEGHEPGDGAVYELLCYPPDATSPLGVAGIGFRWLQSPPPGFGGLVSPATLAARAISLLPIRGPQVGTAPAAGGSGLVGLPVWLWTTVSANTWRPVSATASVPGLSVTATARATQIEWRMGDGNSVVCANPGTPYDASFGGAASPSCSYPGYGTSSKGQPGGRYTVTGVTTWRVQWAGGGETGVMTVTRQSTTALMIDELQVVTA